MGALLVEDFEQVAGLVVAPALEFASEMASFATECAVAGGFFANELALDIEVADLAGGPAKLLEQADAFYAAAACAGGAGSMGSSANWASTRRSRCGVRGPPSCRAWRGREGSRLPAQWWRREGFESDARTGHLWPYGLDDSTFPERYKKRKTAPVKGAVSIAARRRLSAPTVCFWLISLRRLASSFSRSSSASEKPSMPSFSLSCAMPVLGVHLVEGGLVDGDLWISMLAGLGRIELAWQVGARGVELGRAAWARS